MRLAVIKKKTQPLEKTLLLFTVQTHLVWAWRPLTGPMGSNQRLVITPSGPSMLKGRERRRDAGDPGDSCEMILTLCSCTCPNEKVHESYRNVSQRHRGISCRCWSEKLKVISPAVLLKVCLVITERERDR